MAQLPDVTPILLQAQSVDAGTRTHAEQQLKAFEEQSFATYIASLANELAHAQKPPDSRRLAGLLLKNTLDAKDDVTRASCHHRWSQLDSNLRAQIKTALLATLHTDVPEVRHTAALVVAKVAAIELPAKEWPSLVKSLEDNMNQQPPNDGLRQATLEALGYVCEEMGNRRDDVLTTQEVNVILTCVVSGMRPEEQIMATRLAATTALCNAIEFAEHNFDNEKERNYLMQVVFQNTHAPDERIQTQAFQCLHEIAANYYSKLSPYMQDIYNLTVKAIKEQPEEVALQAVEFWSTICDVELDLEESEDSEEPSQQFIKQVCQYLVPVLLEQLTKQEEGQEQDDTTWNLSMAGGACLGLMSRLAGDAVVPYVMPYVQQNINRQTGSPDDWRYREAATFAFGSILEGPSPGALTEIVKQALGFLLQAMQYPHPYVRDTTAWTIGRIFEFLHASSILQAVVTPENLGPIVAVLLEGLKDESHIVYRVCCAIGQLAEGFKGYAATTTPLTPFFKDIVAQLLQAAQRFPSFEHARVQISAFEAINDMVRAASADTLDTVGQLIPVFLREIYNTFNMPVSSNETREKQAEVQGQLCGVLQVIINKLSDSEAHKAEVMRYADETMDTLLKIFQNRSANVHEEAMVAVGAFSYACGKQFTKYLPQFYPYLKLGLQNHQEWQVCLSTVGVLGDICRNVEVDILPYCDEIMQQLMLNLGSDDVHRNIKPHIFSAFGDIALVIADHFEKYLDKVKRMLQQAMSLSVSQAAATEEDFVDYNNELRTGILDAYSGILQGMSSGKVDQLMRSEVPGVLEFISSIARDDNAEPRVTKAAVNLLGDICASVQGIGVFLHGSASKDWQNLVTTFLEDPTTEWAVQRVQQAMQ